MFVVIFICANLFLRIAGKITKIAKIRTRKKLLATRYLKKFHLSESRVYKKWQTKAIIREISDSNLGDREKQFKIWSLPDYPGELTALRCFCWFSAAIVSIQSVINLFKTFFRISRIRNIAQI